ncbi:amidase signature domain-containing protein [Fusarium solani]|uniref:Amidase signature domain-containing protein n=1 Tax=Fusarium solani TaxID=169388 RepID=A0A9P9HNQ1_FUSSL|nr:amidase signature domain-containing protein [Fusarium solani]KAH7260571.1 amidase signature domain-containing protein [Fusarium solani]
MSPSKTAEPWRLTASEVLSKIQADELSVQDYARSLLERIKARDDQVQAWAHLDEDLVIEQAKALDEVPKKSRGPLHGLPIAVKDVIYTKDMPTQHNSSLYEGSFPEVDAASVRTLRHAGALIFGKTTTAQFAAVHVGPKTRNPHDPLRTPGGSSTGSGAVVADFQAPIALGTQTGGSMIRPASFNGIYGLKPTWNSVSREGSKIYSLTFDTLGWFARCVDDLALLADVFGIQDDKQEEDATVFEGVKGARFAICKTVVWPFAGPGTQEALSKAASLLEAHGAIVEEVDLPSEFDNLPEWHRVVLHCEGGTAFLPEYRVGKDHINQVLVDHVENINGFTRKEHLEAFDGMAALRPKFDEIAGRYAAVITPSVPDEAPVGLESTGSHIFCCIWSALHTPVLNVPGFKGAHDMPIGVSLVAPRYHDRHLLEVGKAVGEIFEAEGGWETKL